MLPVLSGVRFSVVLFKRSGVWEPLREDSGRVVPPPLRAASDALPELVRDSASHFVNGECGPGSWRRGETTCKRITSWGRQALPERGERCGILE